MAFTSLELLSLSPHIPSSISPPPSFKLCQNQTDNFGLRAKQTENRAGLKSSAHPTNDPENTTNSRTRSGRCGWVLVGGMLVLIVWGRKPIQARLLCRLAFPCVSYCQWLRFKLEPPKISLSGETRESCCKSTDDVR